MIKSKETGACYENWKRERSPAYQRRRNEDRDVGGRKTKQETKCFVYS